MRIIPTGRLGCEGCVRIVEEALRHDPRVRGVHVDREHEVAHVTVAGDGTVEEEPRALVRAARGDGNPVPLPRPEVSSHQRVHDVHRPAPEHVHFVRPHELLRVELAVPRERGGKRTPQRYRQRTPAMAAGLTSRRWTVRELLMRPLVPEPVLAT